MKRGRYWRSGGAAPAARVVLADDSPLIRTRLAAMLADMPGVEVVGEAADAVQAVALVQELRPDVLVLDLSMPGGGGAAVLRELRSDDAAPVIAVLTNHPYPAYRTQCLTLGAQFFFDKSSEFEKVIEILKGVVAARPKVLSG